MVNILLHILGFSMLGLGVGLLSTGLGLGGGVLMVPAFITFVPGMDIHTAKGTSLVIILFVALSGYPRIRRLQKDRPSFVPALLLILGALAGGYLGAAITVRLHQTTVLLLFIALMVALLLRLLLEHPRPYEIHEPTQRRNLLLVAVGLLAGTVGSATGTGGGAVLAPAILLTGLLPHTQMVYVANQVMIASSLAAAPAHLLAENIYPHYWTVGHVCLGLVPPVLLFAQVGVILGARLNHALSARQRRRALAAVLALVALRMVFRLLAS